MAVHLLDRRLRVEQLETRLALAATVLESNLSIVAETQYGDGPLLSEEATLTEVDSDGAVPFDSLTLHQATPNSHGHAEASITATAPPADGGTAPFGGSVTFFTEQHAWAAPGVNRVWANAHVHWTYTIETTGPVEVTFSYDATATAISIPSLGEPYLFTPVIRVLGPKNALVLDALTGNDAGSYTVLLEQADFALPAQYTIDVWVGGAFSIGLAEHSEGQQHTKATRLELDWTMSALPRVPDLEVYGAEYDQGYVYFSHLAQDYVGPYTVSLYRSSDEIYDPGVDILVDSMAYTSSGLPYGQFGAFEVSDHEHHAAGLPYYLVVIDPQDAIAETNESNNVAALSRPIVSLKAMTFSQMAADILPDPGSQFDSYEGPHYVDADGDGEPEHAAPLLYATSSQVTLEKAIFQAKGDLGSFVLIRGDGPGDFDFSEREATIVGEELWVEDWVAEAVFDQKVQKHDAFEIQWSISIDGGYTWSPIGSSQNTLYVAASAPQTTQLYHSVVDIAVRNAVAVDGVDTTEIVRRIWNDFSDDRKVVRVDGQGIHYYGTANESVGAEAGLTTADVLLYRRGDCSGLVKFFLDVLAVHGIQGAEINVEPIEPDEGFTLHDVAFDETHLRLLAGENEYFQGVLTPITSRDSPTVISEASPGPGITALGPTTVDLAWGFHRLAFVGGVYYDPSYGQTYATPEDFESAVTAFQRKNYITKLFSEKNVGRDLNGNGTATDMFLAHGLIWRKNTPTTDLVFTQLGGAGEILAKTFSQKVDELSTADVPNDSPDRSLPFFALPNLQPEGRRWHTPLQEPNRQEAPTSAKGIHEPLLAVAIEDTYSQTFRSGRLLRAARHQAQVLDRFSHIDEAFAVGFSSDALSFGYALGVTL